MTNIIGMALVILSVNTTTNYEDKVIFKSCKEAGCTNTMGVHGHYDQIPTPICVTETLVIGTTNVPLLDVIISRPTEQNGKVGLRSYREGVFLSIHNKQEENK